MYKHTYITLQPILSPRPPTFSHFCIIYPCLYIFFFSYTSFFLFKSNWKLPIRIYSINHLISLIFARRRTSNVRINISNLLMLSSFLFQFTDIWTLSRWHFRWGRNRMKGHDIWQLWHLWGRGRCIAWSQ